MFLQEITEKLQEHARQFDLEKRAIEHCKDYLRSLMKEEPEETRFHLRGLPLEELEFRFVKHGFVFASDRSWPHVLSRVTFGCHDKNFVLNVNPFGYYALETIENGEVSDDWFWWKDIRDEKGKLMEFPSVEE